MQFRALNLFLFVLVLIICSARAGRRSSYSYKSPGRSSPPRSSPVRTSPPIKISPPIRTSPSIRTSPIGSGGSIHHTGGSSSGNTHIGQSSMDFLHSETGGRKSYPPTSSGTHSGTHSGTNTYPKPVVHETNKQSSVGQSQNDPYHRQPATNPHFNNNGQVYTPSGGYGGMRGSQIPSAPNGIHTATTSFNGHPGQQTHPLYPNGSPGSQIPSAPNGISGPTTSFNQQSRPPYPLGQPSHPHPDHSIGSSSFPSNPHQNQIHPQTHPQVHNAPPPPYNTHYSQYPPPPYQQSAPPYHAPPQYQPATAPIVPGRVVYVDSGNKRSGSGIGSAIAAGVAGGVAAGATNAIVDHAISSIFRPSSNHIHTYPSAPVVGTPTVTHTTNNYYYGSGPGADNNAGAGSAPSYNGNNYNNNNQPQVVGQPPQPQSGSVGQSAPQNNNPSNVNYGNSGVTTGGINDGTAADPLANSNGVVSRTPEGQPAPAVDPNFISDEDLMKFTEELFDKQETNLGQYIDELNLQKRVTNTGQEIVPDEAPEPLFKIKSELWENPTVKTLKALYDNYQRDGTKPELLTDQRRNEEAAFLDEVVKTPVMTRALEWLVNHKFVESDNFEQKAVLRRTWFANFDNTSSGFERIFLSEKFGDSGVVGMQNWIYFAHLEAQNNVNYLGYVDQLNLSGKGLLLKLNYKTDGFTIQNATIFVGTSPELELALYTVCYHARSNNWCPVSLGGAKFFILTHSFQYHKTELIDLGFPAF